MRNSSPGHGIAWTTLAATFAFVLSGAAAAQALQPARQNGIEFITGGVGTDEQAEIAALVQQGYSLRATFAEKGSGAFLADVHVVLADAAGRTLVETTTDGPDFIARLPEGTYRISADLAGKRQERSVRVTARRGTRIVFSWTP